MQKGKGCSLKCTTRKTRPRELVSAQEGAGSAAEPAREPRPLSSSGSCHLVLYPAPIPPPHLTMATWESWPHILAASASSPWSTSAGDCQVSPGSPWCGLPRTGQAGGAVGFSQWAWRTNSRVKRSLYFSRHSNHRLCGLPALPLPGPVTGKSLRPQLPHLRN